MESRQATPDYISDLENSGYHHLSYHLQQFFNCKNWAEINSYRDNLTFPEFSQLILEAREAIIKKVTAVIPVDFQGDIVFLIGNTGSGKSTTLLMLAGDTMKLNNGKYESHENQHNQAISHSLDKSQTFLPNVRLLNNTYFVDFAGFLDSLGGVVRLAEELALKALINLYSPKIFLIQHINDIARMQSFKELKLQLTQFIDHFDSVLLGLTNYINFPQYLWCQNAKENSKTLAVGDVLAKIASLESEREVCVENADKVENYTTRIARIDSNLAALQSELKQLIDSPAPVTEDETTNAEYVANTEGLILDHLGTQRLVRLDHLENPEVVKSCFEALGKLPRQPKPSRPYMVLTSENAATIESMFANRVIKRLYNSDIDATLVPVYPWFDEFAKKAKQSNFIEATQPKVVTDFFNLPELPPKYLKQFSRALRQDCFSHYLDAIMSLNLSELKQYFKHHEQAERYQELVSTLRTLNDALKYHLLPPGMSKKAEKERMRSLRKQPCKEGELSRTFALPAWCRSFPYIRQIVPFALYQVLVDINQLRDEENKRKEEAHQNVLVNRYKRTADNFTSNINGFFAACKKMVMGDAQIVKNPQDQVKQKLLDLSDEQIAECIVELKVLQATLNDLERIVRFSFDSLQPVASVMSSSADSEINDSSTEIESDTDSETVTIEYEEDYKPRLSM